MRNALIQVNNVDAGILSESDQKEFSFTYLPAYNGPAISLTLPKQTETFRFKSFPAFFDGLLPEGIQLEGLLRSHKIDRYDFFKQLITVGDDLVGAITVKALDE